MITLYYVSDREDFWNSEKVSERTAFGFPSGSIVQLTNRQGLLQSQVQKRVLVLIHGYNNDEASVKKTYQEMQEGLRAAGKPQLLYDTIIGYTWPGSLQQDTKLAYELAKKNVEILAPRLRRLLEELAATAKTVDVMAHSMGNRLFLTALLKPSQTQLVGNYYSLAPAVDNESIDKGGILCPATRNCNSIFVFYSKRDTVLKWSFAIAEQDYALGYDGADNWKRLPKNVRMIDCSAIVSGHSEYSVVPAIYTFIRDILQKGPFEAKDVKLLEGDKVTEVKKEPFSYEKTLKTGTVLMSYTASAFSYSQGYMKTALCLFTVGSFFFYQFSRKRV